MKLAFWVRLFVVFVLIVSLTACGQAITKTQANTDNTQTQSINDELQGILQLYGLPSMAAVVISNGQIVAQGAVGVRKSGAAIPVTINDQYQIGSCTKAMTATIIAMLVQQGKLSWTSTMGDIFPEMKGEMLPRYRDVNILELLSMNAGFPSNNTTDGYFPPSTSDKYWSSLTEPLMQQRYEYTKDYLCRPFSLAVEEALPEPGTTYLYSDVDYVIAGAIAERITGKSWEDLMTTMLFKPLGITDAGFSFSMATGYEVNEPWQHYYSTNGQDIPVPPNYAPDILGLLAPVMYPAGGVHMTILDWAKFINMQLEGENGGSKLLAPETFKILHTQPYNDGYALGWEVENDPVFGTLLTHNGSDGFDYADVWMLPNSNFAVLVTTNAGGNPAFEAGSDAIDTLIGKFLSRPPAGKPTI